MFVNVSLGIVRRICELQQWSLKCLPISLHILLHARLHSYLASPYSSGLERWWQQIKKVQVNLPASISLYIYVTHNLPDTSCKMLKMTVWQSAIFMPFYEEKYGRYAAFCLMYAFVRSVHVIILLHPACISFTNHPCSFCLHSMFLPLTSDVLECPHM